MSNPNSSQLSPGLRNRRTLALFILLLALLMADNNLMAPNLTAIGAEFGFSRAEIDRRLGGDISLMFWLLGAAVTLVAGYFTDRTDLIRGLSRKRLLLLLVVIGQGACLASGLSSTYRQLYWARTLTAVGMGAAGPVLGSLLADYVPPLQRPRALGYLNVACSFGVGGGQLLAGLLGPSLGWRIPFLCVGVLGLLVSVLYALWGDDPARGQHEPGLQAMRDAGLPYGERFRLRDLTALLRGRTNAVMLATSLVGTVPYSVVMIFLNDYLAQDRGLGVPLATTVMLVIGFGGVVGNLASGAIMQRLLQRAPQAVPLFCGASTVATAGAAVLLLRLPTTQQSSAIGPLLLSALFGFLLTLTSASPMLLNVNLPDRRGAIGSLVNLCGDLGRGLGAWVVGLLAMPLGRETAFLLAFLLWVPDGLLVALLWRVFPREQQAVQDQLRAIAVSRGPADS